MATISELFMGVPKDINEELKNKEIPKIYTNGFTFGHTTTDVTIILQLGQNSVGAVMMDYTTLKTLNKAIENILSQAEIGLGRPIKAIDEVAIEWQKNLEIARKRQSSESKNS